MQRTLHEVLKDCHVGPEIETLEHKTGVASERQDLLCAGFSTVPDRNFDTRTIDFDVAGVCWFEEIDATEKSALARTGGTEN